MRFKTEQDDHVLTRIIPLVFKRKCVVCHDEFLFERVWRFFRRYRGSTKGRYSEYGHICKTCAPTKEIAENTKRTLLEQDSTRPPPPRRPPPPSKA